MQAPVGMKVLSIGGLISKVFDIPPENYKSVLQPPNASSSRRLSPGQTPPSSSSSSSPISSFRLLADQLTLPPRALVIDNKLIFDSSNLTSITNYITTGERLPSTEDEFAVRFEKDQFYAAMGRILQNHGDFFEMTQEVSISISRDSRRFREELLGQISAFGQSMTNYAEAAAVIYSVISQTLDQMEQIQDKVSEDYVTKSSNIEQLIAGMISMTSEMLQNSARIHRALSEFHSTTKVTSSLLTTASTHLQAATPAINSTFTGIQSSVSAAQSSRSPGQTISSSPISLSPREGFWAHYSANLDAQISQASLPSILRVMEAIKVLNGRCEVALVCIEGCLHHMNSVIAGFTQIVKGFEGMRAHMFPDAAETEAIQAMQASPRSTRSTFGVTLNSAVGDWLQVKEAAGRFAGSQTTPV